MVGFSGQRDLENGTLTISLGFHVCFIDLNVFNEKNVLACGQKSVRASFLVNLNYSTFLLNSTTIHVLVFSKSQAPTPPALYSSRKQSHITGANFTEFRRRTPSAALIGAERMTPSAPENTSVTRVFMFSCRRTDSSISHTPSPTFNKRSLSLAHFGRTLHSRRYPFAHLLRSSDCTFETLC